MHIIDIGTNALIGLLAVCATLCWLAWTGRNRHRTGGAGKV